MFTVNASNDNGSKLPLCPSVVIRLLCNSLLQTFEDSPALLSLGVHDYYPYVFFKMNIEFIETKR